MRLNKFFTKDRLLHIGAVLFWLLVWQGASMLFDEPLLLVSPLRVLRQLFALLGQSAFYSAVWFSLSRIALGFLLGVAAGVLFAIAAAHSRAVETLLHPLMVTVKSDYRIIIKPIIYVCKMKQIKIEIYHFITESVSSAPSSAVCALAVAGPELEIGHSS